MPAPEPITKPSRSASNGRLAPAGSSLRRESACMLANAAIAVGVIPASAPPASIAVARPWRIISAASPLAVAPVAQAETGEQLGPRAPAALETAPAALSAPNLRPLHG